MYLSVVLGHNMQMAASVLGGFLLYSLYLPVIFNLYFIECLCQLDMQMASSVLRGLVLLLLLLHVHLSNL